MYKTIVHKLNHISRGSQKKNSESLIINVFFIIFFIFSLARSAALRMGRLLCFVSVVGMFRSISLCSLVETSTGKSNLGGRPIIRAVNNSFNFFN